MNESINDNTNYRNKTETSNLTKFTKELKYLLFGVLNLLLKEDEISIYFSGILAIIEVFQSSVFLFHPQVKTIFFKKS